MKAAILGCVLCLAPASRAFAGSPNDLPAPGRPAPAEADATAFWDDSFFVIPFEVGLTSLSFPQGMSVNLDKIRNNPNFVNETEIHYSCLGLYLPLGSRRKLLVGASLDIDSDILDSTTVSSLLEYSCGPSLIYFPFGRIGEGFYTRADLGFAHVELGGDGGNGVGAQAGFGYLFRPLLDFRPLVGCTYAVKGLTQGDAGVLAGAYQAVSVDLGCIF
jgi:hypothetical protein